MERRIKNGTKILLGIMGFASVGIFICWLMLMAMGEPEAANEVKDLPDKVEQAKQQAQEESVNAVTGLATELNEERKKLVANEDDPYLKSIINWVFVAIFLYLGIGLLAAFGIKVK